MSGIYSLVSITKAALCEKDMPTIIKTATEYLRDDLDVDARFKVEAKRADKSFPMTSTEIAIELDEAFSGLVCDVHDPQIRKKLIKFLIRTNST